MCDRTRQVTQFYKFFKTNVRTRRGLPQVYLLHGEKGQGHGSFVKRLIIDQIEPYAASRKGAMEGNVHRIEPDVEPWNDIEEVKENIQFGIFEKVSPDYDPGDLSARRFVNHRKLKSFQFVVIQHDFEVAQWGSQLRELIRWYLTSYWIEAGISRNQILIFLKFIYPYSRVPAWLRRFFQSNKVAKPEFTEFLQNLSADVDAAYPCLLFDELGLLDQTEVCRTLHKVGIHDEEECPDWLKKLFRHKRGKVRMEDVERLIKIHMKSV